MTSRLPCARAKKKESCSFNAPWCMASPLSFVVSWSRHIFFHILLELARILGKSFGIVGGQAIKKKKAEKKFQIQTFSAIFPLKLLFNLCFLTFFFLLVTVWWPKLIAKNTHLLFVVKILTCLQWVFKLLFKQSAKNSIKTDYTFLFQTLV